jgi:hypothetical protein
MSWRSKWSLTGKIVAVALVLVFTVVLGVGILVASERTYIQRLRHFKRQLPTPPEWFEPKQIVSGASTPRALLRISAEAANISTNLIGQTLHTATNGHAMAFLIVKNGAIVTEYYAPGHEPNRWTNQ